MRAGWLAIGLALGALAGCVPATGVRAPDAPISSQVNVRAPQIAGAWVTRASWGKAPAPGARLSFAEGLHQNGPGRFHAQSGPLAGRTFWVLWMDADGRTAAIGDPEGQFGWIMDRKPKGGADRIAAAKEIMNWMGYDMSRMME
ncbi:lipocalin family protein [Aquicoccus sp. G2-2]|uniref:lipocalin family protein n=1 Tax=Aquicoccus sp. G2-2 TaxID=3092120 RepID=UPI002ADF0E77|nr:lipocalin family protein [Aquicoccus sp. G2-2]MEA1113792.1 lipocalin family protein [Aquicoccus sp. G2-2]